MATPVTSTTKIETYGFLGEMPAFRKWVGGKRVKSLEEKAYQLINDPYEATVGIHKQQIRSAARRVGKEWVSTGRSRWSPSHENKKGQTSLQVNTSQQTSRKV